jgi:hypothetical protein
MAQTGFTPIQLYSTSTAAAAPVAGNLTNSTLGSELAINITDGKLFYKDNANAVQVIGWKTVPTTAGGTGLTTYTAGDLSYYATGTTFTKLAIGTTGQILTSTGSAPQWSTLSGVAVTTFSAGTTGFTPNSATSGAITLAGTLATTNGGTGLTAFTANQVFYASSTSAIGQSANLTFNGTTLTANTIGAFTLGGTIAGGGNQINNVIIGTSTPLAGNFTTLSATGVATFSAGTVSAPAITTTGDTNTGIFFPTADTIAFTEGGVESMRVDSSGNLCINTTGAAQKLNIEGSIQLYGGANTRGMYWSFYGQTNNGYIDINGAADGNTMRFGTANTERMRITSTGGVCIGNTADPGATNLSVSGNVVIATSGQGIDFSATPGTGTSELFDDYEEGTWSPTYVPSTGSFASIVYAFQTGAYTKVGNLVTVTGAFRITSMSIGTAGGTLAIGGLPFSVSSASACTIGFAGSFTANTPLSGNLVSGATSINLQYRSAVTAQNTANTPADLGTTANTNYLIFSAVYTTAT